MEAEDTVLTDKEIGQAIPLRIGEPKFDRKDPYRMMALPMDFVRVAQVQAQVSFQAGIQKVIDWIEEENGHFTAFNPEDKLPHYCGTCGNTIIGVGDYAWEAQLKKWNRKRKGEADES